MNNQFGNQPPGGFQPPPPPPPGGPFEQPGQQQPPPPPPPGYQQPTGMQPASGGGGKTWILIIVLMIILIAGGLVFASWQGWISLGGIEKLWKKTPTPTTTTTPTKTESELAKERDATRKEDLGKIKDALKKYYQANQAYPEAKTVQKTSDPNCILASTLVPTYLDKLPVDPSSPTYYYGYISDDKTFELTAVLEDQTDASGIQVGTLFLYKVTDTSVETPTSGDTEDSLNSSNTTP